MVNIMVNNHSTLSNRFIENFNSIFLQPLPEQSTHQDLANRINGFVRSYHFNVVEAHLKQFDRVNFCELMNIRDYSQNAKFTILRVFTTSFREQVVGGRQSNQIKVELQSRLDAQREVAENIRGKLKRVNRALHTLASQQERILSDMNENEVKLRLLNSQLKRDQTIAKLRSKRQTRSEKINELQNYYLWWLTNSETATQIGLGLAFGAGAAGLISLAASFYFPPAARLAPYCFKAAGYGGGGVTAAGATGGVISNSQINSVNKKVREGAILRRFDIVVIEFARNGHIDNNVIARLHNCIRDFEIQPNDELQRIPSLIASSLRVLRPDRIRTLSNWRLLHQDDLPLEMRSIIERILSTRLIIRNVDRYLTAMRNQLTAAQKDDFIQSLNQLCSWIDAVYPSLPEESLYISDDRRLLVIADAMRGLNDLDQLKQRVREIAGEIMFINNGFTPEQRIRAKKLLKAINYAKDAWQV